MQKVDNLQVFTHRLMYSHRSYSQHSPSICALPEPQTSTGFRSLPPSWRNLWSITQRNAASPLGQVAVAADRAHNLLRMQKVDNLQVFTHRLMYSHRSYSQQSVWKNFRSAFVDGVLGSPEEDAVDALEMDPFQRLIHVR